MKMSKLFLCLVSFVFVLLFTPLAPADWDPGQPFKMHAPQLPDPNGWDVCLMHQFIADDFMCSETGPITDIHFWTSWQNDSVGWIESWYVAIYSDAQGQPAEALWEWNGQGNLNIREYGKGEQGWLCPSLLEQKRPDHYSFYQVNITDIPEPFIQERGQVYWLVIHAAAMPTPKSDPGPLGVPEPPKPAVGWKNSVASPPGHLWGNPASFSLDLKTWSRFTINDFVAQYVDMSFVITSNLDYGDAPDSPYPTLRANDGARHIVVPGILMGALIDSEPDGQPNSTASGDDENGLVDDEDGVSFLTPLIPGQMATVSVDLSNCPAGGIPLSLNAWIDFNDNGSWAEPEDKIFSDLPLAGGVIHTLSFQVPFDAKPNSTTYARFRLSTMPGLSYTGQAIDGEVEDYTVSIGKFPLTEHLKWSQPPLEIDPLSEIPLYCGWNQPSYSQDMEQPLIGIGAADDFRCIGPMPITSIHWWGSYMKWKSPEPPGMQPLAWSITFWTNVPDDLMGQPSHPGVLLWDIVIPNERVKTQYAGEDYFPITPPESCYRYDLDLMPREYFWQQEYTDISPDNVFWIGIKALYPVTPVQIENPWGWKTRPAHWMDDAVSSECRMLPNDMLECIHTPLEDPLTGESYDLAFELDTDPAYIKWEQPFTGLRDWPHYEDQVSMATEEVSGDLTIIRQVADDWKCEKRTPVTSIVFWGSYLNYTYRPCEAPGLPTPVKPDFFLITIFTDVPADDPCNPYGFSHPGNKVWEYKATNYDEVLVGYDKNQSVNPPGQEAVFRYSVSLPEVKWFRQRKVNQIYWVGIMAVNGPNRPPTYKWGWTNHKHQFNDDAVAGSHIPGTPLWQWEELYDQTQQSADQSFMLFTDPRVCVNCADYDFSGLVTFYDFAIFALDWRDYGLPGGLYNADLDCDGKVNYEDLKIFCNQWLQTCP